MIERLKALLSGQYDKADPERTGPDELQIAAAALLVEAALMDDDFDRQERQKIEDLLTARFELAPDEVAAVLDEAESQVANSSQLFGFTRVVGDAFDYEQRLELMSMLWEVAYVDGELHDFEASLMRRLAGLLHITDRDNGKARKDALDRLGQSG